MPFLMTKIKKLDHSSLEALRADVQNQVQKAKERLGVSQLPLLMLHEGEEYLCDRENVRRVFEELKENKDILYSGISAYSYHDYEALAESGFDAVQIPINIFDWTQIKNGGIQKIADAGMMIFARSVYLQGLIFQDPDHLSERMEFCRDTLVKFRALCEKYDMAPATLALSYILSIDGITSIVLGSENVEQVQENVTLFDRVTRLSEKQMKEIRDSFYDTDPRILNPGQW